MAVNVTSQVLYDGINSVVMQFTGIGDGTGDQETNALKVNLADLNPIPKRIKIMDVYHGVVNGTVILSWDGDVKVPFITANYPDEVSYKFIQGMNQPPDTNGNIVLSTQNFDSTSSYSIKLEMRKKY